MVKKLLFSLLSTDNYVLSILYRSVRLTQLAFPLQTLVFTFLFYPCAIFDPLYSKHQCNQIKAEYRKDATNMTGIVRVTIIYLITLI